MENKIKNKIELTPIGYFQSEQIHPYEAGRQPDANHSVGAIQLEVGCNFEQALVGLEACEKIWVVFIFHHNNNWKPMVLPPRGSQSKVGVFATRSPYRPNPIGISCVDLKKVDAKNLRLTIGRADLLDGTPIIDIKPYISYADSFADVEPAWLRSAEKFEIRFSQNATEQITWLEQNGLSQIRGFILHQLEYEPTNSRKKRVKRTFNDTEESPAEGLTSETTPDRDTFVLAYRTWRVRFTLHIQSVEIENIFSGYNEQDLKNNEDLYHDKELHRKYKQKF